MLFKVVLLQKFNYMESFSEFNISNPLRNAIDDLGFEKPTPIQSQSFSVIQSGKDMVGIAQTGTGKTLLICCLFCKGLNFLKNYILVY